MSYFLFIDESGHDRKESPYEVLGGVSIHDDDLWNLISALHDAEIRHFGRRYSDGVRELKGSKILKKKVFQHAELNVDVRKEEIASLAKEAIDEGNNAELKHLKALALAKLNYVEELFNICARFRCYAFASIVDNNATGTVSEGLRKDYGYLFERFYYFLDDQRPREQGIVVFDELDKSKSHLLINQMQKYFKETATGRLRSNLVIPEPFFVHSDLTTGIQIADLISYITSWGVRIPQMIKPSRDELRRFAKQIEALRYRTVRENISDEGDGQDYTVWSFKYINDLRTKSEKQ